MPVCSISALLAVGTGEFSLLLLILIAVAIPVAAVAFARSGRGLDELGRGRFAVDFERDSGLEGEADAWREEELRQMVEARDWRRERRGGTPGESSAEIERLLGIERDPAPGSDSPEAAGPEAGLVAEIRQVVIARNESRRRRGERPLEVESEIERLLGKSD